MLCVLYGVQELSEVVKDLLLEIEERDALLAQYERERQRLQAQIHDQVCACVDSMTNDF